MKRALLLLAVLSLGLTACGRRAPLEVPPEKPEGERSEARR